MEPGILCEGHEVSSFHGTVESCHHVAEDLVFATSVHLTRNTAFHPTLSYAELFGNKSHLRVRCYCPPPGGRRCYGKYLGLHSHLSIFVLCTVHSLSPRTVLLPISRMLMLARSFSMMTALMSLFDYSSVKVTFCSCMFPRS